MKITVRQVSVEYKVQYCLSGPSHSRENAVRQVVLDYISSTVGMSCSRNSVRWLQVGTDGVMLKRDPEALPPSPPKRPRPRPLLGLALANTATPTLVDSHVVVHDSSVTHHMTAVSQPSSRPALRGAWEHESGTQSSGRGFPPCRGAVGR